MKILKLNGNLIDIMGENIKKNFTKLYGITGKTEHQNLRNGKNYSLLKVTDESKSIGLERHSLVEVLTETQANLLIDTDFDEEYYIYSESLVSASLSQKIKKDEINLDEMLPEWSRTQAAKWLFEKGISGIQKTKKPAYF